MRFATRALRVGQDPEPTYGAVIPPVFQSTTFVWKDLDTKPPFDYTRCGNPNHAQLEQVLASLENGRFCTLFASGMAAIGGTFALMKCGDGLLMANDIYGGTFRMAEQHLDRQGIETTFFDAHDPSSIARAVRPNTRMLVFETPTNPNVRVSDIRAVCEEAHRHGLTVVFDNTFASPALQNPLDLGADVVVHSTTKYISGHSDVIGGAAVTNDETIAAHLCEWNKAWGAVPSPFDAWLALRGVKTMALRMRQHCANAQALAEHLQGHPGVARVHYPGLPDHPDHATAKAQMRGGFGGMMAIELPTEAIARRVAQSTRVFLLAESLGGVESLLAYPPLMSHAVMTEAQRLDRGIPPTMLRLSVGIEDPEDLIEDFERALRA